LRGRGGRDVRDLPGQPPATHAPGAAPRRPDRRAAGGGLRRTRREASFWRKSLISNDSYCARGGDSLECAVLSEQIDGRRPPGDLWPASPCKIAWKSSTTASNSS